MAGVDGAQSAGAVLLQSIPALADAPAVAGSGRGATGWLGVAAAHTLAAGGLRLCASCATLACINSCCPARPTRRRHQGGHDCRGGAGGGKGSQAADAARGRDDPGGGERLQLAGRDEGAPRRRRCLRCPLPPLLLCCHCRCRCLHFLVPLRMRCHASRRCGCAPLLLLAAAPTLAGLRRCFLHPPASVCCGVALGMSQCPLRPRFAPTPVSFPAQKYEHLMQAMEPFPLLYHSYPFFGCRSTSTSCRQTKRAARFTCSPRSSGEASIALSNCCFWYAFACAALVCLGLPAVCLQPGSCRRGGRARANTRPCTRLQGAVLAAGLRASSPVLRRPSATLPDSRLHSSPN